jgi:hypothetical protein
VFIIQGETKLSPLAIRLCGDLIVLRGVEVLAENGENQMTIVSNAYNFG